MSDILQPLSLPASEIAAPVAGVRRGWSAERVFYTGLAAALTAAVVLGFSRTFFFRAWFPEWARTHGPPEPFFYFHGAVFAAWYALLLVQPSLVARGRIDLHRRLGRFGAGLAVGMVLLGSVGALMAAARPTGFMDVPVPPLEFLIVPLSVLALFGVFVTLAIVSRRRPQSHKRYMLLGSIAIAEAGVGRWPFAFMTTPLLPGFSMIELCLDLFLVPMVAWDLATRGRLHPVTLWGGLVLIASQPIRAMVRTTPAWLAFAEWAVNLVRP